MWHGFCDERPKTTGVVVFFNVAELVNNYVIGKLGRQMHQFEIEVHVAAPRTASPSAFLVPYRYSADGVPVEAVEMRESFSHKLSRLLLARTIFAQAAGQMLFRRDALEFLERAQKPPRMRPHEALRVIMCEATRHCQHNFSARIHGEAHMLRARARTDVVVHVPAIERERFHLSSISAKMKKNFRIHEKILDYATRRGNC